MFWSKNHKFWSENYNLQSRNYKIWSKNPNSVGKSQLGRKITTRSKNPNIKVFYHNFFGKLLAVSVEMTIFAPLQTFMNPL